MNINELLDNNLIRRYFGCMGIEGGGTFPHGDNHRCRAAMAYRILEAMTQPIKPMEQALQYQGSSMGHWEILCTNGTGKTQEGWHPNELRLPDAFQPKRSEEPRRETCENLLERINKGVIDPTIQRFIDDLRVWREQSEKSDIVLGAPKSNDPVPTYCGVMGCTECIHYRQHLARRTQ